jgi:putative Ca2+/H+ antiporter (TMEM165/GDT1 family)
MSITEELWFLVAIGGFLVFMEGAIAYIAIGITRVLKRKITISDHLLKVIAGLVLLILALVYLFNLPKSS